MLIFVEIKNTYVMTQKYTFLKTILLVLIIISSEISFSQILVSDNAGETTPDASAIFEVKSTSKGMLIPRMDTNARTNISSPANGLLVFDTTSGSFFIYGTTAKGISGWIDLSSNAGIWKQSGNNVYLSNTNYNVGIGTYSPNKKLVIQANNPTDTLLEILDPTGRPLMIITPERTRFYSNPLSSKGASGGFAVGRYATAKGTPSIIQNFFTNIDSTRIYTDGSNSKGASGGFAVGRYATAKSAGSSYTYITEENYFIGHKTGFSTLPLSGGLHNIFVGYESGLTNTTGHENTYIGHLSGKYQKLGTDNVFLGNGAGQGMSNYTGTSLRNVVLGAGAGNLLNGAIDNVFIGHLAGEGFEGPGITGDYNVIIGESAGRHLVDGDKNIFIGNQAGFSNIGGQKNIFIGDQAGYTNKEADNNVFIGIKAGYSMIKGSSSLTGNDNVFIGNNAGQANDSTLYSTMIGTDAGKFSNGGFNTFIGKGSGEHSKTNYNTYIGTTTARYNETGSDNVIIGHYAAFWSKEGGQNVVIGKDAAALSFNKNMGSGNVLIGYKVAENEEGITNKLFIDNSNTSTPLIYGEFNNDLLVFNGEVGIGRSPTTNNLEVNGTASKSAAGSWIANSDKRIKTNIIDIKSAKETLLKLRPVKFKYTDEWKKRNPSIKDYFYYNYIAQEFKEVFPNAVKGSGEFLKGDAVEILQIDTYNAQILTTKAVQELIIENNKQNKEIEKLKKQIQELIKK